MAEKLQHFENVACTQCGCVCDDLHADVSSSQIVKLKNSCKIADEWFLNRVRQTEFPAKVCGINSTLENAINEAAAILKAARSPLIFGLSHSSTDAQRHAVALAETLNATIDTTASTGHAPSIVALQQVGESTCTLGEVKQRADLVVYWGCDPDKTHPRHRERYAPNKLIYVVDDENNETRKNLPANQFIHVARNEHFEAISSMRAYTHSKRTNSINLSVGQQFLDALKKSRFAVFFFGSALTSSNVPHRCVEELLKWVSELNNDRRCYARRLRRAGDVAGADSVLAWQTGYPFAVNFGPGYPRSNPGEFSGPDMLTRGEIDACLLIGKPTDLPDHALDQIEHIPLIAVESPNEIHKINPTVQLFTADYGIHRHGTAYRMDEVPIPLRPIMESSLPSDAEILDAIHNKIKQF